MGTSTDFCIEGWIYPTEAPADSDAIYASYPDTTNNNWIIWFRSGKLGVYQYPNANFTTNAFESTSTISINAWTHFAFTRSGSVFRLFINGVQEDTYTGSVDFGAANKALTIGRYDSNTTSNFNGYISNLRHVVGRAVYTSNFTPSTSSLGATSGGTSPPQGTETKLLTCQSNRFVDNASTPNTITRNGDVRVTPFSPFAPSAAYDPAVNGGSGYFDGNGDYLTVASAAAIQLDNATAFTIEFWVNPSVIPTLGSAAFIYRAYNMLSPFQGYGIGIGADTFNTNLQWWDGTSWTSIGAVSANTWTHIAISYEGSGTTRRFFINGVLQGSAGTVPATINYTSGTYQIGARNADQYLTGYLSNFRIVKGTAVYTAAFTPPTAPLTAITNTSLLCNFTNAGIFDNTGKNNLETVGDAQIDTTTKKYGTGSMEFDGNGDYLQSAPGNPDFAFGTGGFTIEFWMYANSTTGGVSGFGTTGSVTGGTALQHDVIFVTNNLRFRIMTGSTITTVASPSVSTATWTHFALVREGSTFTVYKDGVSEGTATNSGSLNFNTSWVWRVGSGVGTGTTFFDGYIDDFRITKGVARYTANFTPPTSAFLDK
jgi:hypothetical protein